MQKSSVLTFEIEQYYTAVDSKADNEILCANC